MDDKSYVYIEDKVKELLTRTEDLNINEFTICPDDYIVFEVVINQFNDLRKEYATIDEPLLWDRWNIVIRGCMLLSGLIAFEYEEG